MTDNVALYNWAPMLHMLALGALLGSLPLLWLWRKQRRQAGGRSWIQALTLLTLFLTFDLVMFGAFTRLTDSGLGCPDWPGCYGSASPVGAQAEIAAAQAAMPDGPVTHRKAWIEMIHRYLATSVGFLIVVLTIASWRNWIRQRKAHCATLTVVPVAAQLETPARVHPGWATFTLLWVLLQGAFGAWTVTMKLFPAIVTMHLLGGIVLLMLLTVQAMLGSGQPSLMASRTVQWLAVISLAALLLQIALGGWVSTNYAVLACSTFPDCNGSWWPEMDFAQGFEIWRELGMTSTGEYLGFAALVAIHYTHRLAAYGVIALLLALVWALWKIEDARWHAQWLLALLALQFATGLSNVVLDWPLLAAVLHTGGAAALAVLLTSVIMRVWITKRRL